MLGATRRFGLSQALRASAPRSLSSRWAPQLLKWQPRSTPSPILSKPFHSSFPALNAAAPAQTAQTQPAEQEVITEFSELMTKGLIDPTIVRNITDPGRMSLKTMTDVQSQTIHQMLHGDDILAQAKTGTGKTLAFLVPTLQNILNDPSIKRTFPSRRGRVADTTDIRAIIISPTRELAEQIAVEAKKVAAGTGLQVKTAVGGTQKRYGLMQMQRDGCHLLIGTPGRIKDIFSDPSSGVSAPSLNTLILDEADRLLDQGFAAEIEEIQELLPDPMKVNRQTLMFSATVPRSVMQMVRRTMKPEFKFVKTVRDDEVPTHLTVPQQLVVMPGYENALPAVMELAQQYQARQAQDPNLRPFRAIVYFNSTNEVKLAAEAFYNFGNNGQPSPLGRMRILEIHSRLTQKERTNSANSFRRCSEGILFSSDVTARGMDFPDVTHVIQIGSPRDRETYIHRIGRTARANKTGEGWLFIHEGEYDFCKDKLRDLPLAQDNSSITTASVDMVSGVQGDASSPAQQIIAQVRQAMMDVPSEMRASTIRSMLGVLVPTFSDRRMVVQTLNDLAVHGFGLEEPPAFSATVLNNMGLSRLPGLRVAKPMPRRALDSFDQRSGGRGFTRHDDYNRRDNYSRGGSNRSPRPPTSIFGSRSRY